MSPSTTSVIQTLDDPRCNLERPVGARLVQDPQARSNWSALRDTGLMLLWTRGVTGRPAHNPKPSGPSQGQLRASNAPR